MKLPVELRLGFAEEGNNVLYSVDASKLLYEIFLLLVSLLMSYNLESTSTKNKYFKAPSVHDSRQPLND